MKTRFSIYYDHRLIVQLLAITTLYFAIHWLIPIVGTTLIEGIKHWNLATILYCWLIQYLFIVASIELRESLIKRAGRYLARIPRQYLRLILLLASFSVIFTFLSFLYLLIKDASAFSVSILIEYLLLACQVWSLCGAAVPISAKRFYILFLQPCYPMSNNVSWHIPKERNKQNGG